MFEVLDADRNGYLNKREWLEGLTPLFKDAVMGGGKLVFQLVDTDGDDVITVEGIMNLLNRIPITDLLPRRISPSTSSPASEAEESKHHSRVHVLYLQWLYGIIEESMRWVWGAGMR